MVDVFEKRPLSSRDISAFENYPRDAIIKAKGHILSKFFRISPIFRLGVSSNTEYIWQQRKF